MSAAFIDFQYENFRKWLIDNAYIHVHFSFLKFFIFNEMDQKEVKESKKLL